MLTQWVYSWKIQIIVQFQMCSIFLHQIWQSKITASRKCNLINISGFRPPFHDSLWWYRRATNLQSTKGNKQDDYFSTSDARNLKTKDIIFALIDLRKLGQARIDLTGKFPLHNHKEMKTTPSRSFSLRINASYRHDGLWNVKRAPSSNSKEANRISGSTDQYVCHQCRM